MEIRERLVERVAEALALPPEHVKTLLEVPPDEKLGDYALPCFSFAKELKKAPPQIAAELAEKIGEDELIATAKATGPYLNLFLKRELVTQEVISAILNRSGSFGPGSLRKERVMVEYSQPNSHKAFHVGHLRGTSIGEALARILRHAGFEVVQTNYSGDTGMHVAKWLWCYLNFHNGETPPAEGKAAWLASIYVDAITRLDEEPERDAEVRDLNRLLDEGADETIMDLWSRTRQWSIDEFTKIYEELHAHFDYWFWEREMDERAKTVSQELLDKGIAKASDGAVIMDFEDRGKGVWVLLREDGTPLYSAKDIALAEQKFNKYDITRSIYVVGKAQALHMEQLFLTLNEMGFEHADKCFHLSFEEVRLPDGKMSSRTGKNILYHDLRKQVFEHTEAEIRKRHDDWDDEKVAAVTQAVGVCALKFEMIYRDHNKNITFDAAKVCDFEGDTGPYIQYTNARCNSILKKGSAPGMPESFAAATSDHEYALVKKLAAFPTIIDAIVNSYYPELLAKYALELAKIFNKFYHECKVLGSDAEAERTALVEASRSILEQSLTLLAIDAPKEM
jgi:arginyl-tRNA synthetase